MSLGKVETHRSASECKGINVGDLISEVQDIQLLSLRTCCLHLHWWLVGTVFQPWVPSSEVWWGLALEVSPAGHWCVPTWVVCQVAQRNSLLCNEISPRQIPALEAFQSSWRLSESTLLKQVLGLPPPQAALRWLPGFCGVFQIQKPKRGTVHGLVVSENSSEAIAIDGT